MYSVEHKYKRLNMNIKVQYYILLNVLLLNAQSLYLNFHFY